MSSNASPRTRVRAGPDDSITTLSGLAAACGCTTVTAAKWIRRRDFPRRTSRGWSRLEVIEYAARAHRARAEAVTGAGADIKRVRIEKQVEKLVEDIRAARASANLAEMKEKEARSEYVTREVYERDLSDIAHILNDVLNRSEQMLLESSTSAESVEIVKTMYDRARADAVELVKSKKL